MAVTHLNPRVSETAARAVANALARVNPSQRETVLREMLAHVAGGLAVIAGPEACAEAVYRLADAIVARWEA